MLGLGLGVVQVLWYSTVRLIKMGNSKVKVGYTSFALLWSCVLFCCHQKQIKAIWIQNMCKESLGNFMFLYCPDGKSVLSQGMETRIWM